MTKIEAYKTSHELNSIKITLIIDKAIGEVTIENMEVHPDYLFSRALVSVESLLHLVMDVYLGLGYFFTDIEKWLPGGVLRQSALDAVGQDLFESHQRPIQLLPKESGDSDIQ